MTANSDQNPPANIEAANDALPEITGDQRTNLYREVCRLLNAKETVLRALKRMGPTKAATKGGVQRRNWIRRRDGTTVDNKESKSTGYAFLCLKCLHTILKFQSVCRLMLLIPGFLRIKNGSLTYFK